MFRSSKTRFLAAVATAATLATQSGCSDEGPTAPIADEPPVLPAPDRLSFAFDFFQEPTGIERAAKNNFFNAYIRATVASAITHLLVAPPLTVFALALHTVPSPQDDGSWIWVYTSVHGEDEAQIRLRGLPLPDGRVQWELRASSTEEGFENELWFEGETWKDGEEGVWRFHDFERPSKPVVARLEWGEDDHGRFLRLADEYDHPGNSLEYRDDSPMRSFTWTDAGAPEASWFVRWNEIDGSGSLRAPDYNGGVEACWDDDQDDSVCPPAL
jgi:hypothetical protein